MSPLINQEHESIVHCLLCVPAWLLIAFMQATALFIHAYDCVNEAGIYSLQDVDLQHA